MPNRVLSESVKRSEQIDQLSWFDEVVFYRALLTADDYGCLDGRPKLLKSDLFPTRDDVTRKSIEDSLAKLTSTDLLRAYEVSGKPYMLFPTWEKHQRIRRRKQKYPWPCGRENDVCPYGAAECNKTAATCCQCAAYCGQVADSCRTSAVNCPPESESNPNPNPNQNPKECAREASEEKPGAPAKPTRHKHGFYKNVLLSDEELEKLKAEFPADWADRIERLSGYIESKGAKYKNHLATIRMWARKDGERNAKHGGYSGQSGNGTKPVLGKFL